MNEAKMDLDRTRAEETSKWLWVAGQKEGEEKAGQKQHGVELLKRKEMEKGGLRGREPDKRTKTENSGKKMSRSYPPPGAERIDVKGRY